MEFAPSSEGATPEIAFGFLDIAELDQPPHADLVVGKPIEASTKPLPKIKCVVWDLDNTIWDGVLIEDGLSGLRLRSEIVGIIVELDRKGILQSVASKNNPEDALAALRHFGLADLFLFPRISWAPKSEAIRSIREQLDLGIDTFAFVDDQEFERAEVHSRHPEVLAIDPSQLQQAIAGDRFRVQATEEGALRRRFYLEEAGRREALQSSGTVYEDFLRSCEIEVRIADVDWE